MSKIRNSVFNSEWQDQRLNPEFWSWIKPVATNRHQAKCTVCNNNFELSNMGRRAVRSHLKSAALVKGTHLERDVTTLVQYSTSAGNQNRK